MSTPTIPDDVFDQFTVIDKALAHAVACLALGLMGEMLEQLVRAQTLSHSLNFRLESERMLPATSTEPEQAVLL